jgi:hypothetical protein
MKTRLILAALSVIASSAFAVATQGPQVPQGVPADVRAQPLRAVQQAPQPNPPRHLSEQERAELRRQLQQFNQQFTRRQ